MPILEYCNFIKTLKEKEKKEFCNDLKVCTSKITYVKFNPHGQIPKMIEGNKKEI